MSKKSKPKRTPKYRLHKKSGRAFVELNGRRIYLGDYESPDTRQRYHALIAEWEANGRTLPVPPEEITVTELLARFWKHAQGYYRDPDGTPSGELVNFKPVIRRLRSLYGESRAIDFGPRALKAVRKTMIDDGLSRKHINKLVQRIRWILRWAASEELVPASVPRALATVVGLKKGRSEARESEPVRPVPDRYVDAVKPHVSRQVWTIIELQRLTAARSGELVLMRPIDIDTSDDVWVYQPQRHKTGHLDHDREIYLGPRAQEIVRGFLDRPVVEYMFSPREADAERRADLHARRKTPLSCGNGPGTNRKRKPKRVPGEKYTPASYRRAIQRACKEAGVDRWHPHQLRHNAGTLLRKEFGIETARVILGHRSLKATEIYAEEDRGKAVEVMARVG